MKARAPLPPVAEKTMTTPNLRNKSTTTPRGETRKNLTISTLIAECEEYVQTDKFTRDLSSDLVSLFKGKQADSGMSCPDKPNVLDNGINSTGILDSEEKKPPRVPQTMRTKLINVPEKPAEKIDKTLTATASGEKDKRQTGKFPGIF